MPIEDPMLPTLMTGQPAAGGGMGGGLGQAPKPSPKPPQSPGLQNNTNSPQWWGGGAPSPQGATSGYGGYTPTPTPPPTAPPTGTTPPGGTPPAGTPPAGTPATPPPKVNPNQGYIDMLQRRLVREQGYLRQMMNTYAGNDSYRARAAINNARHALITTQNDIAEAQLKAQQAGY